MMLGKLMCWWSGHKRGKRGVDTLDGKAMYQCPRCGATWTRKVRAKKAQAA